MPKCSRVSEILLSFKYLHYFDFSDEASLSTTCKEFQQMRCLKAVSVEMIGSAESTKWGR